MRHVLVSSGLLVLMLVMALVAHWLSARIAKGLIASARPLATGEHQSVGYERRVHHTADPEMRRIVATVLASGLVAWIALVWNHGLLWILPVAGIAAAIVLDLRWWERVAASASSVWVQRGMSGEVHRLAIEDIRDLAVDEEDGQGPTLRNLVPGGSNTVCRLRLRMSDKRVVTLPHTDASSGLAAVEAVANHVRLRQQQAFDQQAMTSGGPRLG